MRKGAGEPEEEQPLWRGKGKASAEDGTRQEEDGLMEEEEVEEQEEETIWLQCAVGLEVEDVGGSEERTGEESDEVGISRFVSLGDANEADYLCATIVANDPPPRVRSPPADGGSH